MPIGNTGGGGGGVTFLSSTTLGGAGTFNISIPDSSYSDLIVSCIIRGANNATNDGLGLTFNSDTTAANYNLYDVDFNLSAVAGSSQLGTNAYMRVGWIVPAATASANSFGVCEFTVYGYAATTWFKQVQSRSFGNLTTSSAGNEDVLTGTWLSTAAVTSLQLFGTVTANLAANSQVRLYGRK